MTAELSITFSKFVEYWIYFNCILDNYKLEV